MGVGVGCHRFWGRCWSGFQWVLEWVSVGLVGGICNGLSWWVLRWFMQWDFMVGLAVVYAGLCHGNVWCKS